jgi:hypothetical protein
MANDGVTAEGGYVTHDCRTGDMITWNGENWVVVDTFPTYVKIERRADRGWVRVSYNILKADKAFFAGRFLPCLPPEGEVKI